MTNPATLGFIGLGVMGEPMCRHLVAKSGSPVVVFDLAPEPMERLAAAGAARAGSAMEVAERADIVFLSLPSGRQVEAVCEGPQGLIAVARPGQTIVDTGTSPLKLTKALAARFAAKSVDYADAPIARTRQAAEQGTLAVTVGASDAVFARIEPLIRCYAADITHCGEVGSGEVVKILNNMVLAGVVASLCEAATIARAAGIETQFLFEALSKGSADSFGLRNHGLKAIAPREFPLRAFSTAYMLKDISYALAMAEDAGFEAKAAERSAELLHAAIEAGFGDEYWPVIAKVVDGG